MIPCGWGDNRRSGVALAMRHRLQWFIHSRPKEGVDRYLDNTYLYSAYKFKRVTKRLGRLAPRLHSVAYDGVAAESSDGEPH